MTLDDRIREGLEAAAGSVEGVRPSPVEDVRRRGTSRQRVRTAGWGVGLVVVLVGILYVSGLTPDPSSGVYLADGETVVSADPLVVQGAIGPEPRFDTSVLGEEVTLGPIDDVERVLRSVEEADAETGTFSGGDTFRVTLLGETPEGSDAYVTHSIVEYDDVATLQNRCVRDGFGGSCGGVSLEEAESYPGGLIPAMPNSLPGYGTGGPASLLWEVVPEASVVMLTVDGERSWTRPVSQVAVFTTDLRGGESVRATVFAQDGEIIARHQFTADVEASASEDGFNCPVTIPNDPDFSPPEGYPASAGADQGWFGNADLWTVLPVDASYGPRKSVWWSQNFEGGNVQIPITVTWQRLDVEGDPIVHEGGTNAFTESDGWFMIAGIDPDEPGCWEVTAVYKGATVRYVYEKR